VSGITSLDEGKQIFVEESRDLLRQMEQALMDLEGQPDHVEAMNALFRAAHTIKGSAGLFAFDRVVAFTHVLENVLERVRAGQQALDADLAELALRCSDHVGALLDVVTATGSDDGVAPAVATAGAALVARLESYLGGAAKALAHATAASRAQVAALPSQPAAPGGATVARDSWHLSLRFGANVFRSGMDPLSFLRYLGTLGTVERLLTITDHLPDLADLDPESCHLGFELLLRSDASESVLRDVFEFVQDDCRLQLLAPHAPLSAYAALVAELPEGPARARELLLELGALSAAELDGALAAATGGGAPAARTEVTAAEGAPSHARSAEAGRFLRVPADKLDRLITLVGELVIAGSASSTLASARGDAGLREAAATVDGLVEEVRESAMRLRMVQVGDTFNRFQRVVRDVSRELGKDIALVVTGGETELDKSVVERMNDPLTHIVRNAIDHGIEDREARVRAGKSEGGTLRMHAYHDSGSVVIEVSDDGRGLDRERILNKARERGLVEPDEVLTDEETLMLIFEPGFSTAEKVTNLSGRGVGMDVVRRNISELRGTVSLHSEVGKGTTVTIRLPLTLAIIDGFLVKVGTASYVVPLDMVFECIELPPDVRTHTRGGDYLNLRSQVLPLLRLRETFRIEGEPPARQSVVVLQNGGQRVGLVVDQLLGERQTVIKPLGSLFASVPGIGGSTVLGTGEVALIIDVPGLIQRALARQGKNKRGGRAAATTESTTTTTTTKGSNHALV
jgi:two-component system chemotaxis sensor kinase CheA